MTRAMVEANDATVDSQPVGWSVPRMVATAFAGLTVTTAVAAHLFMNRWAPKRIHSNFDWLLGGWLRWDSWWYVNIATHGYTYRPHHMSSVAFFPVYPLTVRALAGVAPISDGFAAIAVTVIAGAVALWLFEQWCRQRMTATAAHAAVVSLAIYPFAWFLFGAGYSDALFLALVLAAFALVEADRPGWAAVVGAIATATRPTGVTLVIGLLAVCLERRGWLGHGPRQRLRRRDLTVALSITGLFAWCAWLWIRFGNPFAFAETEGAPGWNQPPEPRTWFKLRFVHYITHIHTVEAIAVVLQVIAIPVFIWAIPHVARRFGAGYGIYTVAVVLFPAINTADFLGVGRYLLPAFPVFALLGEHLHTRPRTRRATWTISSTMLVTGTALYAAGYLIA